jgi:hypothetical protein
LDRCTYLAEKYDLRGHHVKVGDFVLDNAF